VTEEPTPGAARGAHGVPNATESLSADDLGEQIDLGGLFPDDLADLAAKELANHDVPEHSGVTADPLVVDSDRVDSNRSVANRADADQAGADRIERPATEGIESAGTGTDGTAAAGPPTIWEQMGGPMGMIDSGLPVVVFIVANVIGGLGWGIGAALAAAVVIAIMRIARKRPVTQAIAGFFGVGVAAFIAYKTDSAKGYFLLGIWSYLLYGGALLLSVVVRWPLIGVIWEGINGKGTGWRANRKLVRRYDLATLVWVLVFAARYLVQNYLYDTDQVGWLAAVRLLMGYPVFILAIAISVWIVAGTSAITLPAKWSRKRSTETG
jgi:hypothetical protein